VSMCVCECCAECRDGVALTREKGHHNDNHLLSHDASCWSMSWIRTSEEGDGATKVYVHTRRLSACTAVHTYSPPSVTHTSAEVR
jgi:hypothetical protein